MEPFVELAATK